MSDFIDKTIILCISLLALLAAASFVKDPTYAKGVDLAMGAVANALSAALGAKFGLAQPRGPEPRP